MESGVAIRYRLIYLLVWVEVEYQLTRLTPGPSFYTTCATHVTTTIIRFGPTWLRKSRKKMSTNFPLTRICDLYTITQIIYILMHMVYAIRNCF